MKTFTFAISARGECLGQCLPADELECNLNTLLDVEFDMTEITITVDGTYEVEMLTDGLSIWAGNVLLVENVCGKDLEKSVKAAQVLFPSANVTVR